MMAKRIQGVGLGLRRGLLPQLLATPDAPIDFLEVAPENWIGFGGRYGAQFAEVARRYPVVLHGLSLNLGGPGPLDMALVDAIAAFMGRWQCPWYSEHLSACADDGHLYDLMPVPFSEESVHHISARIRQVQDRLGCRIAVENASYYAVLPSTLDEATFINAVLEEADCDLLLDVNNIHVNSINHGYDAQAFLRAMPGSRIRYLHVAGHFAEAPDLCIDTHGAAVTEPVWALLESALCLHGVKPVLLERDFNIPPLGVLLDEAESIRHIQSRISAEHSMIGRRV